MQLKQLDSRSERWTERYLVAVPLVFIAALIAYKSRASFSVLQRVWTSGTMTARPEIVGFGDFSGVTVLQRSINYFDVIWPALLFGILIGAAVRAFVSPNLLMRMFTGNGVKAQITAGIAGAPLMLCSCCAAPVFTAVYERSQRLAPSLAVLIASPSLNPAALALTFLLFDWTIATGRLAMAIIAVVLTGPVVGRVFPHLLLSPISSQPQKVAETQGSAAARFLQALGSMTFRTAPVLAIGVISSMLLVAWLPPSLFVSSGARLLTLLLAATIAVPLALPTFLEIPLAMSLLAAGLPAGAAAAFLFAGPAINLPSLFGVSRSAGWKVSVAVAAVIWMVAVMVGSLL